MNCPSLASHRNIDPSWRGCFVASSRLLRGDTLIGADHCVLDPISGFPAGATYWLLGPPCRSLRLQNSENLPERDRREPPVRVTGSRNSSGASVHRVGLLRENGRPLQ